MLPSFPTLALTLLGSHIDAYAVAPLTPSTVGSNPGGSGPAGWPNYAPARRADRGLRARARERLLRLRRALHQRGLLRLGAGGELRKVTQKQQMQRGELLSRTQTPALCSKESSVIIKVLVLKQSNNSRIT